MKKVLIIAAACVALVSCLKNDEAIIAVDDSPIGFQTVIGLESTRAAVDGITTGDKFMASAFLLNENMTWASDFNSAQQYFVNQDVAYVDSKWTTTPVYYWPSKGSLTFFAHYPANSSIAKFDGTNYVFEDYNVDTHKNIDLMVADVVADKQANNVPVTFRHKLTRIGFTAIKADDVNVPNRTVTITSIKLTNLNNEGTLTQTGSTGATAWSAHTGTAEYELVTSPQEVVTFGTNDPQPITTDQIFFLPQDFTSDAAKVIITYTVTTPITGGAGNSVETITKEFALSSYSNFGMNCYYTFNLQIGAARPIIWEQPTVQGWATSTFQLAI